MTPAFVRRLLHASTVTVLLLPGLVGWPLVRVLLLGGVLIWTGVEVARNVSARFGAWLTTLAPVFRPAESGRPSGAWYLLVAYAAVSWLPPGAAMSGILVGALADPSASLAGSWWKRSGGAAEKTWVGTGAALGVGFLALGLVHDPIGVRLAASVVAAAAERWSGPVNDNLVVGPAAALTVLVLG